MNFQTMSKQRKFVLLSATVGFISMFLPWVSISMFGYSQSVNGMHDKGILVFLCFVATGVMAYLGDQTKNLDITMWTVTLLAGAIALLFTVWFYLQATDALMGTSLVGFGVYIAALAAIGILASAYIFRTSTDNLKDGFNEVTKNLKSKIDSTPPPPAPPPAGKTFEEPENITHPL